MLQPTSVSVTLHLCELTERIFTDSGSSGTVREEEKTFLATDYPARHGLTMKKRIEPPRRKDAKENQEKTDRRDAEPQR
jgi:hypothetical protein